MFLGFRCSLLFCRCWCASSLAVVVGAALAGPLLVVFYRCCSVFCVPGLAFAQLIFKQARYSQLHVRSSLSVGCYLYYFVVFAALPRALRGHLGCRCPLTTSPGYFFLAGSTFVSRLSIPVLGSLLLLIRWQLFSGPLLVRLFGTDGFSCETGGTIPTVFMIIVP